MAIEIRPLCDALGAEVIGADLTKPLLPDDAKSVDDAFLEHHLLCFRSDPLEAGDFARVATYFSEPQLQLIRNSRHDETPEVSILESTYKTPNEKPNDLEMSARRLAYGRFYFEVPAKATMLRRCHSECRWPNQVLQYAEAYEDFPDDRKSELDDLQAVHSYDTRRAPGRPKVRTQAEANETPDVVHPLVRTHEDTGRKSFYFNANRTDHIVGWERVESDNLLDEIYGRITRPKYQYHHEWRVGDLLLWDNRCLVHSVNVDYPVGERRLHQRILLRGSRPV